MPFKGTLNFSGTIYQYPKQKATVKKEQNSLNKIAFIIPDELKTEEQLEKDRLAAIEAEKKAAAEAATAAAEEEEESKALEQEKIDLSRVTILTRTSKEAELVAKHLIKQSYEVQSAQGLRI